MSASITVELSPEVQDIVQQAMAQGEFASPAEVVSAALQVWQDVQDWPAYPQSELQRMCDEALADERPGIPSDEAYSTMLTFSRALETEQRQNDAA
jgi:Arc/MetJ-type ribon-helix-helix transcriptional regulator